MHKTEKKTPYTFQFLKQQTTFVRTGVKQVKKIIILCQTLYLWRCFLYCQGRAMSEVTELHYSENNYDLKLCLFVFYSDWDQQ